jgi:phosphoribosylglycinamide formyltransferase-1
MRAIRLGILGSGSGSNFQALHDAIVAGTLDAEIALVMSDNSSAALLHRARESGIKHAVIDCRGFSTKFPLEAQHEVAQALREAGVDLVCLAGFMRLIKTPLLDAFPNKIINVHPSLLPAFPGLEAWKQALDEKAPETGCTVHFVDSGMDTGTPILQAKVPVLENDSYTSLHARIQEQEHLIYPQAVCTLARKLLA